MMSVKEISLDEAQTAVAVRTLERSVAPQEAEPSPLPKHLMRLPGQAWALWRLTALRAAGFPSSLILKLASAKCAGAADRILQVQDELRQAKAEALRLASEKLAVSQLAEQQADNAHLFKFVMKLKKGKQLPANAGAYLPEEVLARWRDAQAQVEEAQATYRQSYQEGSAEVSRAICEIAGMERFREAVTWQNRQAVRGSIDALLRMAKEKGVRAADRRRREAVVATYLQRYCLKNDTIGFFGPVGWANFVGQGETISVRPGPELLAARDVYFENWCIDLLASTLAQEEELRPWLAPRRIPYIHLEGTLLYVPLESPSRISPRLAAVLRSCDGLQTAQEIARRLIKNPALSLQGETDVYAVLEDLHQRSLITWTLEVPTEMHAEQSLRRLLERVEDEELREWALGALNELELNRQAVKEAAGDADKLDQALSEMEDTFVRLTGTSATRDAGKMYAARTIVYEDCRRDIELDLGPALLQKLGPPLALLLNSARWFSCEMANVYRQVFKEFYDGIVRKTGSRTVDLAGMWMQGRNIFFDNTATAPVNDVLAEFQRRWAEVLSIPAGEKHVSYTSKELRSRVQAAFAAPRPGWKSALYHSPDVMIAAANVEAIKSGDFELVLGEMHITSNTLRALLFLSQHPAPEQFMEAANSDLPEPRVVPIIPKRWPGLSTRTEPMLFSPKDFRLEVTQDSISAPGAQRLPLGALVVEDVDGNLMVRTRDHVIQFEFVEFFAELISNICVDYFKILPHGRHTPRVSIDRLVICREAWSFKPEEVTFAFVKDEAERFCAARQWARDQSLPRFIFFRVPIEVKPLFVDFDSPTYVDFFARCVRRTAESSHSGPLVTVSEMLPRPDQIWLPDQSGQTFTSEFRVIAVDQLK